MRQQSWDQSTSTAELYILKKKFPHRRTMCLIFRVAGPGVQGRGVPQHDHRDPRGARLRTGEGSRVPSAPPPPPRAASGASPLPPALFFSQITICTDGSVVGADPEDFNMLFKILKTVTPLKLVRRIKHSKLAML